MFILLFVLRRSFYNLKRYPTPQIVSIYCGLLVFISIFSRIFLICTVTVAISPTDSISQISRNNSSFVNTWFGFSAKKVRRSNSFVVNCFSSSFTQTRRAVLSMRIPRISMISFFASLLQIRRSYRARCAFTLATSSLGENGFVM